MPGTTVVVPCARCRGCGPWNFLSDIFTVRKCQNLHLYSQCWLRRAIAPDVSSVNTHIQIAWSTDEPTLCKFTSSPKSARCISVTGIISTYVFTHIIITEVARPKKLTSLRTTVECWLVFFVLTVILVWNLNMLVSKQQQCSTMYRTKLRMYDYRNTGILDKMSSCMLVCSREFPGIVMYWIPGGNSREFFEILVGITGNL